MLPESLVSSVAADRGSRLESCREREGGVGEAPNDVST